MGATAGVPEVKQEVIDEEYERMECTEGVREVKKEEPDEFAL